MQQAMRRFELSTTPTLLAAAVMMLTGALPAAAQERPTAEPWFSRGTWMIGVQFAGAAFTDFQRATAVAAPGTTAPEFRRRVSARTTGSAGAWVGHWLGSTVGVRAAVAYAPSSFTVWNDRSAPRMVEPQVEPSYARLGVVLADAALLFRFPHAFGRVVPYGLVGGGVVAYRIPDPDSLPPEARSTMADGSWVGPAGLVGVGATLPLQRWNLLLNFELTNHISRTPLDDAGGGERFELGGVPLQLRDPANGHGTDGIRLMNHVRLGVGLTLPVR